MAVLRFKGTDGEWHPIPARGPKGADGRDGASAYELAVAQGYTGTLEAWLAMLRPPKPNLLDNSDFRAGRVINQRGQTSYASVGYAIDRWYKGTYGTVTLAADGVTFTGGADGPSEMMQRLIDVPWGKTVTCAFWTTGGHVHCVSTSLPAAAPSDHQSFLQCEISTGIGLYLDFLGGSLRYGFLAQPGKSISLQWAALYEGAYTVDTLPPYQYKGYAAELAECQRYYRRVAKDPRVAYQGYCFGATQARITLSGGGAMRIVPTVTPLEEFAEASAYLYQGSSAIIPSAIVGVGNVTEVTVSLNATGLTPNAPCVWRPNCAMDISADL